MGAQGLVARLAFSRASHLDSIRISAQKWLAAQASGGGQVLGVELEKGERGR